MKVKGVMNVQRSATMAKKSIMKLLLATMAVVVLVAGGFALSGCSQNTTSNQNQSEANGPTDASTRPTYVVDAKGREIEVPEKIERIGVTCMGGALQTMSVLGGADRVVVAPSPAKSAPLLLEIFPQYNDIADAGTFDDVNIETLANANPDFVFVSSTSDKGNAKIEELGIPTYTLSTANASVDSLRQEYLNVGVLLGTEEIAGNLVVFWDDLLGRIDDGLKDLQENDKLTVYRCGAAITKVNHTPWAANWIRAAGGIPAVEDGTTGDMSVESLIAANPDVIITSANIEDVLNDSALQDITAVKNKAVYNPPKGCMGWDVPSPEVPLGFAWLAQKLYPERFEALDIEKETKGFYKDFYGYTMDDAAYQKLLNQGK